MKRAALVLLAMLLLLAGCAAPAGKNEAAGGAARVVTDVWGREVEIPERVESIICLGSGAPRIAAYLGAVDMLVGAEDNDIKNATALRDYNPAFREAMLKLPVVGAGGGSGANNGYPEQIIKAAPDVILAGFSAEAADELQGQTGIPVVCVRYFSTGFIDQSFYAAMRVFAGVTGKQRRCEEVLEFIDECKSDLQRRTADIPDSEKPKTYAGAVTYNGRHGFSGTCAGFGPLVAVNANNVADEAEIADFFEVDPERVLQWDPDIIFLDPGSLDLVGDEYRKNPGYFNSLRAFEKGEIYSLPSFNNCGTNITYALIDGYHAGKTLYPGRFADIETAQKGGEILEFMLGSNTFSEMERDGLFFGKITIDGAK